MRSVINVRKHLLLSTDESDYDVVTITETWLHNGHYNNEFISKKYNIFRKDRINSTVEESRGGGVLIAVKNEIDCAEYHTTEMTGLEAICVKIPLQKGNMFIYCLYIQPSADMETYNAHTNAIRGLQVGSNDILVVAGDFNLPNIKWVESDDSYDLIPLIGESESMKSNISRHVTTAMTELGLSQLNEVPNSSGNVLDLIYTNVPELLVSELAFRRLIPSDLCDKAHNPLIITVDCNPSIFTSDEHTNAAYCFRKANFDQINEFLNEFNFDDILSVESVDQMIGNFYDFLYQIFERFVPKSSLKRSKNPVWFNKQLCTLKNTCNRQYKKLCAAKKMGIIADTSKYENSCKEFDELKLVEYDKYVRGIAEKSKENSRAFWKFVNGKISTNSLPCKLVLGEETAVSDGDKANLFAKFLSSVYIERPTDNNLTNFINSRNDQGHFKVFINPDIVQAVLARMDLSKGQGPDCIPPMFLRKCAEQLAKPLSTIFNKSLKDGKYPDCFKIGHVIPIYKNGKKTDVSNYRGVTIMKNLAKVFERVVYDQLSMKIAPKLSKNQHGFLSNRCIETNLMEFVNYAHEAFEQGIQVDVFFGDMAKAFDVVPQPGFIRKISRFQISNQLLHWLNSYSSNRKQIVKVNSSFSEPFTAHSAIGQGTICGPLFFLTFFDDSDHGNESLKTLNFADDKKICRKIKNQDDSLELQKGIDNFIRWCDDNGMSVNAKKCKIMTFSHKRSPILATYNIKGEPIERVNSMRDLGVIMDPKLNFNSHTEYAKKKADSKLAFVKRECFKTFKFDNAMLLYKSLVIPLTEFGSVIWSPYHQTHKNRVESTQKQAVMFFHNDYKNRQENDYVLTPYIDRCNELGLTSLIRRRVNASTLLIYKILHSKIDSPTLRSQINLNTGVRSLRNLEFIKLKYCRTDCGLNSPFNLACRAFNHASLFIDPTLPFLDFKNKLLRLPDSAFGVLAKLD